MGKGRCCPEEESEAGPRGEVRREGVRKGESERARGGTYPWGGERKKDPSVGRGGGRRGVRRLRALSAAALFEPKGGVGAELGLRANARHCPAVLTLAFCVEKKLEKLLPSGE